MINKTLATFGCSFTDNYHWPTHSDIMSWYYKDFIDFSKGGVGNRYIFHSIINALRHNVLNSSCDVIIQWSSCLREDKVLKEIHPTAITGAGSIFNNSNYPKEYVDKYFSVYQGVSETVDYIYNIKTLLTNLNINYKMTFMLDPRIGDFFGEPGYGGINGEPTKEEVKFGRTLLPLFDELIDDNFTSKCITMHQLDNAYQVYSYSDNGMVVKDGHPGPMQYYTFFYRYIAPLFDNYTFKESDKLEKLIKDWDTYARIPEEVANKRDKEPTYWPGNKRYQGGTLTKEYEVY